MGEMKTWKAYRKHFYADKRRFHAAQRKWHSRCSDYHRWAEIEALRRMATADGKGPFFHDCPELDAALDARKKVLQRSISLLQHLNIEW